MTLTKQSSNRHRTTDRAQSKLPLALEVRADVGVAVAPQALPVHPAQAFRMEVMVASLDATEACLGDSLGGSRLRPACALRGVLAVR